VKYKGQGSEMGVPPPQVTKITARKLSSPLNSASLKIMISKHKLMKKRTEVKLTPSKLS
jgi:hypothetical protein